MSKAPLRGDFEVLKCFYCGEPLGYAIYENRIYARFACCPKLGCVNKYRTQLKGKIIGGFKHG